MTFIPAESLAAPPVVPIREPAAVPVMPETDDADTVRVLRIITDTIHVDPTKLPADLLANHALDLGADDEDGNVVDHYLSFDAATSHMKEVTVTAHSSEQEMRASPETPRTPGVDRTVAVITL